MLLSASSPGSNPVVQLQEMQNGLYPCCFMQGPPIADCVGVYVLYMLIQILFCERFFCSECGGFVAPHQGGVLTALFRHYVLCTVGYGSLCV